MLESRRPARPVRRAPFPAAGATLISLLLALATTPHHAPALSARPATPLALNHHHDYAPRDEVKKSAAATRTASKQRRRRCMLSTEAAVAAQESAQDSFRNRTTPEDVHSRLRGAAIAKRIPAEQTKLPFYQKALAQLKGLEGELAQIKRIAAHGSHIHGHNQQLSPYCEDELDDLERDIQGAEIDLQEEEAEYAQIEAALVKCCCPNRDAWGACCCSSYTRLNSDLYSCQSDIDYYEERIQNLHNSMDAMRAWCATSDHN